MWPDSRLVNSLNQIRLENFMDTRDACVACGSEDDICLEPVSVVHRPPDAYAVLFGGALISAMGGSLLYAFTGVQAQYNIALQMASFVGLGAGFAYYHFRTTWAKYLLIFCSSCRKKYANSEFNRMAIKILIAVVSIGGAIIVSAVMGSDDYIYIPLVLGGLIGVIAFYFKLLSKPKFVTIGDEISVINIPGVGQVKAPNPWPEE